MVAIAAASLFGSVPIMAQVTVGTSGPYGNCIPFGCASLFGPRYQQIYDAAAFSGPLSITALSFFCTNKDCNQSAVFGTESYAISLSTTSRSVTGLSAPLSSNVGPNATSFFSGAFSGMTGSGFTIHGSSFNYNPSSGNLLLDITIIFGTETNTYFDAGSDTRISRAYGSETAPGFGQNSGLLTGFNVLTGNDVGYTVPEPASIALIATGLLAIVAVKRRRA